VINADLHWLIRFMVNWETPFVGVTYQLSKHYELYWRVTKETNDNLFAGNTATLGFARNF
jgi:hypothetical protein